MKVVTLVLELRDNEIMSYIEEYISDYLNRMGIDHRLNIVQQEIIDEPF